MIETGFWIAYGQDTSLGNVGSCTRWLRIIPSARESGTIPPFHHRARGGCHDSTPFVLPVGDLGTPVAVCHVTCCLAQPMRDRTGNVSHTQDRKSTRLNSSHVRISYAVFCLK